MQTELAVNSLPLLLSIFDNLKVLFRKKYTIVNEENSETQDRVSDILTSLTTLNIEGADPSYFRIFESAHPAPAGQQFKENYQVPRAIGYMIEFDQETSKNQEYNIQLRTSRSTYDLTPGDLRYTKNLVLIGSSLHVRYS